MVELSKEEFLKILEEVIENKIKCVREDVRETIKIIKEQEQPAASECAENEVWDAEQKKCVAKPAEPAVQEFKDSFGCIVGEEVFSEAKKECVKLTESEKTMLAPVLKMLKAQYTEAKKQPKIEEASLVEAHKEIVDLKAKVADVEKQLQKTIESKNTLKESINSTILGADMRYFNPGAVKTLNNIQKILRSSE